MKHFFHISHNKINKHKFTSTDFYRFISFSYPTMLKSFEKEKKGICGIVKKKKNEAKRPSLFSDKKWKKKKFSHEIFPTLWPRVISFPSWILIEKREGNKKKKEKKRTWLVPLIRLGTYRKYQLFTYPYCFKRICIKKKKIKK